MNEHELNTQMLGEIAMMISDDVPRTEGLCTTADSVRWLRDKLREIKRARDEAWAALRVATILAEGLTARVGDANKLNAELSKERDQWRECSDRLAKELSDYATVVSGGPCTLEALKRFEQLKGETK